ncbi:LuxR C-terminal-related transcriptional regulator [Micromonospora sp. CA-240977]|uniref:helix-turn-helix transcriptional regulator n=1 Tax=Micromonospora sp. CA-240977 TaxID=3239957 RepID=UPI003D92CBCC
MHPTMSSPHTHELVGRDVELARLDGFLEQDSSSCGMVIVAGARGIGKSALLAAGARSARRTGHRRVLTLRAAADSPEWSFRSLLLAVRVDLADVPSEVGVPALAFLGLEPGARPPHPDELPSVVQAAVAAVAAVSPLLIVADDAHAFDRQSIVTLIRLSAMPGVVVLGASRDPLPGTLDEVPVLRLGPLEPGDAARLFTERSQSLAAQRRAEILHQSAGNPAALVELSRNVCPAGGLLAEFTAKLAALPAPARDLLLRAAALLPTSLALLYPASSELAAAWRPAEAAGFVTFSDAGLTFAHPLAAEAVYRAAPAHLRLRTHRHLAVALTAYPEHQALQLAAAASGADEGIAAALEGAAAIFRNRGELYEATVTMQIAAQRSPSSRDAACRLTKAIAYARDLRDITWVSELHARMWQLTDDPDVLAEAAVPAASALLWAGRHQQAYGILVATHRAGSMTDPRNAMNLAVLAALIAWLSGDEEHRLGVIPMLEAAGASTDHSATMVVRAVIDPAEHWGRELCDNVSIPLPGTPLSGESRSRLGHLGLIAWVEDRSRLTAQALDHVLAGELLGDLAERRPLPGLGMAISLVASLIDIGEWKLAQQYAGTRLAEGLPMVQAGLASLRAHMHALRSEDERAMRLAQETWQHLEVRENLSTHVRLLHTAGLVSISNGDHDNGYRYLRSMFDLEGRPLHRHVSSRFVADFVIAAVHCDRLDDARTVVDEVRYAQGSRPTARMDILLHLSEALLEAGEEAERHFRQAVQDAAGLEWPYEHALAHLHYGLWLRRNRRPREAKTMLSRAAEIFTELGAVGNAAIAERELAIGTQPSHSEPRPALSALTSQEQQVAALAVRGLNNRAIAEQLFISPRTVSTHLSRIYRKAGINGRHELKA